MTDEQLIHQIEQALADLKAGDETALDRLTTLLVDGDRITVGDVSGSTAVAIGSDIRITIRQSELPEELVSRLIALADELDRRAESTFEARGHIRVFLSSPGDVADERKLAMKAISQLQNDPLYNEKITIEAVAWDKPDDSTPLLASIDPQTAINNGLAKPSDCDIVVTILWSRMGTPLDPNRYQKPDGSQYLSGTEWEFEEALAAAQKTGRPFVVVYRRTETPKVDLDDPDLEQKIIQRGRVKAFFDSFTNPDGSSRQGYNAYETPSEFGDIFELHLRKLVARLIDEGQRRDGKREADIDTVNIVPPAEWPPGVSPFPGLRAFGPDDAPIYFGRGLETDKLVKRLSEPDCRFLAVIGASGSGKSSLVGAGLIPRLADNAIEGSKDWLVVRFTPDEWGDGNPFNSITGALVADPLHLNPRELADNLRDQSGILREVLERALAEYQVWAKVLVLVDQFEELFTRVNDEKLRRDFAAMLAETARSIRIKTVITMRADFFHRVAELPRLAALLKADENRTFPLSAPGSIELYEMISGPAKVAGLQFESGLAQQILYDTGEEPGALALMAYALQQLYEESEASEGWLTWEAYESFGGVQGAIGEQAKDAFEQLSEEAQGTLPVVFRDLVEVDESGLATRKRAQLDALQRDESCEQLVTALTDARLLVQSGGEGDHAIVEVAHEALFRSWPRLAAWINEVQGDLILIRQVKNAAHEWNARERNEAFRWPHERLVLVYEMLERLGLPEVEDTVAAFIRPEADRLLDEINDFATSQSRRAWIGDRLSEIGDTRPGIGVLDNSLPDIEWLPVDGGTITLEGFRDTFTVSDFYFSKYPITYAQYRTFLEAEDGYGNSAWWEILAEQASEAGQQYRRIDNHPAENVSWYDAVAFCRWFTARKRALSTDDPISKLLVTEDWIIRLPAEWEWQQAATNSDPERVFPWGSEWDTAKLNTRESGLNRTVAVGMYPHGASPYGALGMSGNIREWCINTHEVPNNISIFGDARRVVRGGSWYDKQYLAGATTRYWNRPSDRKDGVGFRVVCGYPLS